MEYERLNLKYLEANGYYPITNQLLEGCEIPISRRDKLDKYDYVKFRDGQPYFYSRKYLENNSFKKIECNIKLHEKCIAKIKKKEKIKSTILKVAVLITVSTIVSCIITLLLNRINF